MKQLTAEQFDRLTLQLADVIASAEKVGLSAIATITSARQALANLHDFCDVSTDVWAELSGEELIAAILPYARRMGVVQTMARAILARDEEALRGIGRSYDKMRGINQRI